MPWHGSSEFAHASHFAPLDRNGRAAWRFMAQQQRSARRLTADHLAVALAVLAHHGPDGRCDPTHETLAAAARCCARTVRRALARLAECGLVEWTRRLMRTRDGARQTSSAYRLRLTPRPGGQPGRGTKLPMKNKAQPTPILPTYDPAAARTLAEIARERTKARIAAWKNARMA